MCCPAHYRPTIHVGTDLTLSGYQWQPFVGVPSLGRAKAPKQRQDGTLSCGDEQGSLTAVADVTSDVSVQAHQQFNGYTCLLSPTKRSRPRVQSSL